MIPITELVTLAKSKEQTVENKRFLIKWYIFLNTGFLIEQIDSLPIGDKKSFNKKSKGVSNYFKTFQL